MSKNKYGRVPLQIKVFNNYLCMNLLKNWNDGWGEELTTKVSFLTN